MGSDPDVFPDKHIDLMALAAEYSKWVKCDDG